jgi:hypothetical protein
MADLVAALRRTVQETDCRLGDQEVFDLAITACWACCSDNDGGNKTCPPKKEVADV